MFLLVLSLVTLFVALAAAFALFKGVPSIANLEDLPPLEGALPSVSIVVAARNEEKNIEEALQSLLGLDYPAKTVMVMNDRSTDRTGDILRKMAAARPELKVVDITTLPSGWLGKNFAHYTGAEKSKSDTILFTDADIVMEKSVLRRAVGYMEKQGLDHLAISPKVEGPSFGLKLFLTGFGVFFNLFARPWDAKNPKRKAFIGIGAFNLVRRPAYERAGTHKAIAMRPDDDMKLGKIIKDAGFRQEFVLGLSLLRVEWYDSVKALVDGLMKNAFSGVDYRLEVVIMATVVNMAAVFWPLEAIFLLTGPVQMIYAAVVALMIFTAMASARMQKMSPLYGLGFPIATAMFLYIIWKATLRTLIRGGIEWRGTFYPLEELKKNKV